MLNEVAPLPPHLQRLQIEPDEALLVRETPGEVKLGDGAGGSALHALELLDVADKVGRPDL